MQYIAHKRFKQLGISGKFNIPAMSLCEERDGMIYYNDAAVCYKRSENGHEFFARDDDGQGMRRGELTQLIQKTLSVRDEHYQPRWSKIWEDDRCLKYQRPEHPSHWLWNHDFFEAPIEDLVYIAELIDLKV